MNIWMERSGLDHEQALQHIAEALAAQREHLAGFRVRCLACISQSGWRNVLCVIRGCTKDDQPTLVGSQRYDDVHLLERWLTAAELLTYLERIPTGTIEIDGEMVLLAENSRLCHVVGCASQTNRFSPYPGYLYRTRQGDPLNLPSGALFGARRPTFTSVWSALREWAQIQPFYYCDTSMWSLQVFLPECRARFHSITSTDRYLHLFVARSPTMRSPLHLKGAMEHHHQCDQIDRVVPVGELLQAQIDLPSGLDRLHVVLIDGEDTVYDCYEEPAPELWSPETLCAGDEAPFAPLLGRARSPSCRSVPSPVPPDWTSGLSERAFCIGEWRRILLRRIQNLVLKVHKSSENCCGTAAPMGMGRTGQFVEEEKKADPINHPAHTQEGCRGDVSTDHPPTVSSWLLCR